LSWEWITSTSTVAALAGGEKERITYKKISPAHARDFPEDLPARSRNLFGNDPDEAPDLRSGEKGILGQPPRHRFLSGLDGRCPKVYFSVFID
jgi:hypothetical protein